MKLGQAELLVIDEAAAIPLPLVKKLLGPYLVFMASTINGSVMGLDDIYKIECNINSITHRDILRNYLEANMDLMTREVEAAIMSIICGAARNNFYYHYQLTWCLNCHKLIINV